MYLWPLPLSVTKLCQNLGSAKEQSLKTMPVVSVRIPQIGEGLQEARLVAVLKKPGDTIKRDEHIYQMETDKAVMDVESPYEGTLVSWSADVDTILPIGGEVAKMEVAEGVEEMSAGHGPAVVQSAAAAPSAAASGSRNANIPPRTRAYAKEKGISDDVLATIASKSGKLMPEDVDAYLAGAKIESQPALKSTEQYEEQPISQKHRLLASRLVRGNQLAVQGTISVQVNWQPILEAREKSKNSGGDFQPSTFTMFAYAVAKALAAHPGMNSIMVGDSVLRTYKHVALGIAVALPGDELVTAVTENADTLTWVEFANRTRERIEQARNGKDQATEAVTLSLTNMQNFGLRDAVPVVVPPACGVLFLGEVYNGLDQTSDTLKLQKSVNITLTFDHRIANGVGAANFINAVKANVEQIAKLIEP